MSVAGPALNAPIAQQDAGSLTCSACGYRVSSLADRTDHYKTEWHRYNVKRRCAGLPAMSELLFNTKLQELKAQEESSSVVYKCKTCGKTFQSASAHAQHLQSRVHLKKVKHENSKSGASTPVSTGGVQKPESLDASLPHPPGGLSTTAPASAPGADADKPVVAERRPVKPKSDKAQAKVDEKGKEVEDEEDEDAEEEEEYDPADAIPVKHCLFCAQNFDNIQSSLDHMLKAHGFFIPFAEFLTNLEGLLEYLGEKIGIGRVCIHCNGRGKARYRSVHAVQQHMEAKNHCKIRLEDEDEDEEFLEFYDFPKFDGEDDDEEEDEAEQGKQGVALSKPPGSALVAVNTDGTVAVPSSNGKRTVKELTDLGELVLSDGTTLGHRDLKVYYRQNIRPERPHESTINTLTQQYRALQLPGYQPRSTKNDRPKWIVRRQNKERMKIGMVGNVQRHYKSQIDF